MYTMHDVTMMSVNYFNADYLLFSKKIFSQYNKDPNEWVVLCNRDVETPLLGDKFRTIEGVSQNMIVPSNGISMAAYQHGHTMNKGVRYIHENDSNRFLLIIDPDFFLFTDIEPILSTIVRNGWHFFGVPFSFTEYKKKYHSTRPCTDEAKQKMMGFPIHFCEIIDREKVDISKLDYIPNKNDCGNLMFETYYDRPRAIAPFAFGEGADNNYKGTPRKEAYKFEKKLFGIHYRSRTYYRSSLYDDWFKQCEEYINNLNMDEVQTLIDADYFGDGSYPGYMNDGWSLHR